ncbi:MULTISPECIES: methylated-DNA--[protein]-cysteine S-methyltransferase [Comamonas]|uniref:methylated-DNA--[protein]-cysteine S-methyltransferase n=1 Tax=Comamonas TaxID=283 RepID=UPI000DE779D1|nr:MULTISPECIES: methylated-DNA--[protein]-cysteine S-methyltransferase [Comamonas]PWB15824.1 methylated-DNA--protein-cysteine methyltransferase [Comamonas sp. JNW]
MAPLNFVLSHIPSPQGPILLLCDEQQRLRALDWQGYEARMALLMRRQYPRDAVQMHSSAAAPAPVADALAAYFDGELRALDRLALALGGTDFQRQVWTALRAIPAGSTRSYASLATQIGRPAAVRALGMANGANPISIVLPCHRVIGSDASLTGYAGGLARKQWLLAHEARHSKKPA